MTKAFAIIATFAAIAVRAAGTVAVADGDSISLPDSFQGVAYSALLPASSEVAWSAVTTGYVESAQASTFSPSGTSTGWKTTQFVYLPSDFPFYGGRHARMRVGGYGMLTFEQTSLTSGDASLDTFKRHPMVAALWNKFDKSGDIYVSTNAYPVTVAWRCKYSSTGGAVNAMATLHQDGRIVLSYGSGNADGGFIGVSAGDESDFTVSSRSQSGSMANAQDIVFTPKNGLPDGLSLSSDGLISGVPAKAGEYVFPVEAALQGGGFARATVTISVLDTPVPSVGRIYRLTGASFPGNRLVLRAKPEGYLEGASYVWKRDGATVATTERLDIPALSDADFGTYTLTVTTPYGEATSEPYVLEQVSTGTPDRADGNDGVATPDGITGVAQIADGADFSLGLLTNGTVAAWGGNAHGACTVPPDLSSVSFVAAGGCGSQGAGFAARRDGTVAAWGSPALTERFFDGYYDVGSGTYVGEWRTTTNGWDTVATMPADLSNVVKLAAGGYCAIALMADGTVVAWGGPENYAPPPGLSDVVDVAADESVLLAMTADGTMVAWDGGGACAIPEDAAEVFAAAGDRGRWEIAPDSDGDCISDAVESIYARDPFVWEEWRRTSISGAVLTAAGPAADALVLVYDASGNLRGSARTGADGSYRVEGLIPASYVAKAEAVGAIDAWFGGAAAAPDAVPSQITVPGGAETGGIDFVLEPGQGVASAKLVRTGPAGADIPDGAVAYLDMWPAAFVTAGTIDIGELAEPGCAAVPHCATVRLPGAEAPVPAPVEVVGREGAVIEVPIALEGETGTLEIFTEPAGAEVFIDRADTPVGVTPLRAGNILAGEHAVLLRRDGCLRPRPVMASVAAGETTEILVPLHPAETAAGMSVEVSCVLPDQEICLDYLPTGEMAPATVSGLDPASYEGTRWRSASHSILLRHPRLRPWAPRYVPEPQIDAGTGIQPAIFAIGVSGPQINDDSARMTQTTPVAVPRFWLEENGLSGDGTDAGFEAAANAMSRNQWESVWECYMVGLDPNDPGAALKATIHFENGEPVVETDPPRPSHTPSAWYIIEGKDDLMDSQWHPKAEGHHFFRVRVEAP